jgi:sugar phosphate isomerase/epimerase
MKSVTRREFLKSASILSLGLSVGLPVSLASPAAPHLKFPTAPRARLAVTSWPFREFIDSPTNPYFKREKPGMDITEFPAMVATKFDVNSVCPLAAHFRSTDSAYLDSFRQALERAGSHMVDFGLGGGRFWDADQAKRQQAIDTGKHWIDVAVVLGSPGVRQHLGGSRSLKPDPELAAQTLGQMADYGATKNVIVNLENDDLHNEDPFFIAKVIEKVENPYLRALPDFGNTLLGGDPGYNERGVAAMLKHAYGVCHVKDVVVTESGKTYDVDLPKMFALAKDKGFQGYFVMEWDGHPGEDPYQGTKRLIAETLQILS